MKKIFFTIFAILSFNINTASKDDDCEEVFCFRMKNFKLYSIKIEPDITAIAFRFFLNNDWHYDSKLIYPNQYSMRTRTPQEDFLYLERLYEEQRPTCLKLLQKFFYI